MLGMLQTAEGLPLYHQIFEGNTAEQTVTRDAQIQSLEQEADELARELDAQDQGQKPRGRKLSDGGFKVLKSDFEIGPVYHRLPVRIRAHSTICFMALVLHRDMRMRLKAAGSDYSPPRALEQLRRVQYHRANLNAASFNGISTISAEQLSIFTALDVSKPTASQDMTLL